MTRSILLPVLFFPYALAGEGPFMTVDRITAGMDRHDQAMASNIAHYTCLRRYSLENKRFHKKASLNVRMTYTFPGHKRFEILSEEGSSSLLSRVLRPMLEAEEEASGDEVRPHTRMVTANYGFKLLDAAKQHGPPGYLLEVIPKVRNKFLIHGRIWIDRESFGIMRVEAVPAQSPSVLIHNTHITQESQRFGEVWLPVLNRSESDSYLFGHSDLTIQSSDYQITMN